MGMVGMIGTVGSAVGSAVGSTVVKGRPARRGGKRPSIDNMEAMIRERPPFSSDLHGQSSSKKLAPRSVAIPYSRVRKERFYDWPPDPTVSRATPLQLVGPPPVDPTNVLKQQGGKQENKEEQQLSKQGDDDSLESLDEQMERNFDSVDSFENLDELARNDAGDASIEPVPEPAYESAPVAKPTRRNQPLDMPIPPASPNRHQTIDQQLRQRRFLETESEYNETSGPLNDNYSTEADAYQAEYEAMGYG